MKPKSNYISKEQFEDLINYIPYLKIRKWLDRDVEMVYRIAYWLGLRFGEAVKLKAEDFDLDRKEVYLGKTKTRKEDYAAIPKPFIPTLRQYLKDKKGPLLPDCDVQNVYKWLMKAGKALNIQALTTPQSVTGEKTKLHIMRKSFGKDMYYGTFGKKATLGQVQSQLRHANPVTTGEYLKLDIEGAKEFWEPETIPQD